MREKIEVLEDEANTTAQTVQGRAAHFGVDVLSIEDQLTRLDFFKPVRSADQG